MMMMMMMKERCGQCLLEIKLANILLRTGTYLQAQRSHTQVEAILQLSEAGREREKLHIIPSHLGLIRCLDLRAKITIGIHTFFDKLCNCTSVMLPHELNDPRGNCI